MVMNGKNGDALIAENFSEECYPALTSVSDALYAIGGKWTLKILTVLFEGNKRFRQLQQHITGISARVLSHELKKLELNGFVQRNIHETDAVLIDYELTPYSHTLHDVIVALGKWGKMHRNTIRQNIRLQNVSFSASNQ